MTSLLHPRARPLPALFSTLALAAFYWGLFRMPVPGARGAELDQEESRRIQDEADFMRRLGKWDRALKPTLKLHAAYPESPVYLQRLGEIYDHLGRFAEESAVWEQFLDRSPTPIEGCPQAGQAYEKQGLGKQAIATFERCLGFQPGNPDSTFYLAHALERDGETDRAAALYEQGASVHPGYADLTVGLARMRLRQGRVAEARTLSSGIVARDPKNVDALLVLGLSYRRLGERAAARGYLERGAQLADRYIDFQITLAHMAEEDADVERAIRHYQKAAGIDRSNTEVTERLALLRKARE